MIISCGTDIVEIKRMKSAIKKWKESFSKRIFTENEIKYSMSRRFCFEHLAARFAAKEAVLKAFGDGFSKADFKDIEITNDKNGRPQVKLKGNLEKLRKKEKVNNIVVSMSHTRNYAQAVAILVKERK